MHSSTAGYYKAPRVGAQYRHSYQRIHSTAAEMDDTAKIEPQPYAVELEVESVKEAIDPAVDKRVLRKLDLMVLPTVTFCFFT